MTKRGKLIIGILSAVALAAVIGLSVALGITESKRRDAQSKLYTAYAKSYYETMDNMQDIEMKLNKLSVIGGTALKRRLLNDVWRECEVAASDFSQLGTESEELSNVIKFLNQLGDYCLYLSDKLKSAPLTDRENANIIAYYDIVKQLNTALLTAGDRLMTDKKADFGILGDGSFFGDAIKAHSSVEYPEMIYDGPFSDGLNDREAKLLRGEAEISAEDGAALVARYFPDATDLKYVGEGSASIPTYTYEFTLGRNTGSLQISKAGGYPVMYDAYCVIDDPVLTEEECKQKADTYLARLGYTDMEAVWIYNNNSTVYINYAYCTDDVVVYPDLIKVKVCSQTGDLIGLEAQNYVYNHTDRNIVLPDNVPLNVSTSLTVESQRYCIIPTEYNTEIYAKEVVATARDMTYYIYYDLSDGEEYRVMVVIDNGGRELM